MTSVRFQSRVALNIVGMSTASEPGLKCTYAMCYMMLTPIMPIFNFECQKPF